MKSSMKIVEIMTFMAMREIMKSVKMMKFKNKESMKIMKCKGCISL